MVVTRSSAKSESMSEISEEICKYFSELIKPLATNTSLKEMFDKMKEEVISKFELKIIEQKITTFFFFFFFLYIKFTLFRTKNLQSPGT